LAQLLYRLGTFTARRRWIVLAAWLVLVLVVGFLIRTIGGNTSNNLDLPGTGSQEVSDLLAERFPPQQNGKNPIVFEVTSGTVESAANKEAIQASRNAMAALPHVVSAPGPYGKEGAAQVSKDKRIAFVPVLLSIGNEELTEEIAQRFLDAANPARDAGIRVAAGGQIGTELSEPATESSERIGIAAAMVILTFTFGTLVAMGLPIISAAVALIIGLSVIGLLGNVTEVPSIAPTLATMIGLGVGIDYALFLVIRYRAERAAGLDTEEAVATAVATSGTAIVFAGSTVVLALVTLLVAGIPLVTSLGYASAVAVVTAVLGAITLLPAILAILGRRIDSLALPSFLHRPEAAAVPGAGAAGLTGIRGRWARFVVRHPWRCVGIALLVLVPLIIPFLSLQLGQEDVGATPPDTTERQAYDLLTKGFGVGFNGPLLVAVELGSPAKPSAKFERQDKKAKKLKRKLEQEQQQGEVEASTLTAQGDALEERQAELEGEEAALESEAAGLDAQRAEIAASRASLEQQRTLRAQLDSLTAEADGLARDAARLAAEAAAAQAALGAVRAEAARIRAELSRPQPPGRRERLEARLAELEQREAELVAAQARIADQQAANQARAQQVQQGIASIREQAAALGTAALGLVAQAESAAAEAVSLGQQKSALESAAADAQVQAAQLQAREAELEADQKVAKMQQRDAEQLKGKLTRELTNAGGDDRGTDPRLVALQRGLRQTVGVKVVSPPDINKKGDAAIFTVIARSSPADPKTADLVVTIRDFVIPQRLAGTDAEANVGGQTASYVDLAAGISSRLGLVIVAVVTLGFLVLMTAFRSVIVPAQAAVANVLSVAAAFGVVTACFQLGWGIDLVGVDTSSDSVPIASFVPLIMFAVLFGLSMDYQVFLMSQIEQHRADTPSDQDAIAVGLANGARVITAAALIMMSVFASFILNGDPTVKQFGVGLSVGVALAAMTVLVLAPALLVIAGRHSFWMPAWAERVLPHIDIEGAKAARPTPSAPQEAPARG
jgi:uncharacterized membrane protein YdfJ with MMPL/SSD domain